MRTEPMACGEMCSSIGCDQASGCAARVAPIKRTMHTCTALGVCQGRKPSCRDCLPRPFAPFAPGVIEAHRRPVMTREQRREWAHWLAMASVACAAAAAIGLVVGVLSARIW